MGHRILGWVSVLTWIFVCLFFLGDYKHSDHHRAKSFLLMMLSVPIVAGLVAKKFTVLSGVLVGYLLATGMYPIWYTHGVNGYLHPAESTYYRTVSATAMIYFLVFIFFGLCYKRAWDFWLELGLALSTVVGALYAGIQVFFLNSDERIRGIANQASASGVLLVLGLPFLHRLCAGNRIALAACWVSSISALVLFLAVDGASTPIGALAVLLVVWFASSKRESWPPGAILHACSWVAAYLLGLGYVITGLAGGDAAEFFSDNMRVRIWKLVMGSWWETGNHWFGNGFGWASFSIPTLQGMTFVKGGKTAEALRASVLDHGVFTNLHNDLAQVLYESGYLGFFLCALVFIQAVYLSYRQGRHGLVAALFAFAGAMFLQPLLRLPLTGVCGLALLMMALLRRDHAVECRDVLHVCRSPNDVPLSGVEVGFCGKKDTATA